MIKHRVINGTVMVALLIGALRLPTFPAFLIVPTVVALTLWEFYGMLAAGGLKSHRLFGTVSGALLVLGTGILYAAGYADRVIPFETGLLAIMVFAVMVRQCFEKDDDRPLITVAMTLLGVLYIAFLFNFVGKILMQWPEGDGRFLVFYLIVVVKCMDMAAYFTGCGIGKHKLIPRISPAKTWEGCIGGVAGGLAASLLYWWIAGGQIGPVTLGIADAVILGIVLPITGIVGDLVESLLKRAAAVKDSGGLMKGLGGVLDVLDSLLFAAPILYIYTLVFLIP